MGRGWGTTPLGAGNCRAHGGGTPNGQKAASREAAASAVVKLGLPIGSGDPFLLLTKAVQYAEGYLEASGSVLAEAAGAEVIDKGLVTAAAELHAGAIRAASRTGKAAVDADVADRMAALDERTADLLMRFVGDLFDRFLPAKARPAAMVWARGHLVELADVYDRPAAAH